MLTSASDNRQYAHFVTSRGLQVLFVQGEQYRKSVLSMSVGVGHFHDPEECQGLTHLLEHMLFLGSKASPGANEINQFVASQGGSINAWTGTEYANFHLDVNSDTLQSSLDRFADMLCHPLFDQTLMDMEIQAIDAEFKLKQKDDLRRLYQVHKETCNPAHPFSKFSVGNTETLRFLPLGELQTLMQQLHESHFTAPNMRLCVMTNVDIETCKAWVEDSFRIIKDTPAPQMPVYPDLYLPEQLGTRLEIKPVKAARRLIVTFALPNLTEHYRTKPLALISHILGDEGKGSVLCYFKKQHWATSLSAGGGISGSNFKDFNINMQLTETGLDHLDEMLKCLFAFIEKMRDEIVEPWRYEEKMVLAQQARDFGEPIKALDEATHLSGNMFHYPVEHIVVSDYLLDRPDRQIVLDVLGLLTPDNMRIKVIHPDAKVDRLAQWYQTPYGIEPLPAALVAELRRPPEFNYLALPNPNPYIVKIGQPAEPESEFVTPQKIFASAQLDVWFAQDDDFRQPKGDCFLSFDCGATSEGIAFSTQKRLWVALLMEQFGNDYYQAGVAGLHYHLYPHQAGFSLHTSGFSQRQLDLLKDLFLRLFTPNNFARQFAPIKAKHCQALQNSLLNKPINRLFTRLSVVMQRLSFAPSDMLEVMQEVALEDIVGVQEKLFNDLFVEGFIHGDFSSGAARQTGQFLTDQLAGFRAGEKIIRDVADLRGEQPYLHRVQSQSDEQAVVIYFQSPSIETSDIVRTIVFEQLLANPFFHELRTVRQLGYLVGSGYMPFNQHPGMAFYVQSPNHSVAELEIQIRDFLMQAAYNLEVFQGAFEQVRSSILKQLSEPDTNLGMKSQRLWMAIGNEDLTFSRQAALVNELQAMGFSDMQTFAEQFLQRSGFGELVLYSGHDLNSSGIQIEDLHAFKATASYIK